MERRHHTFEGVLRFAPDDPQNIQLSASLPVHSNHSELAVSIVSTQDHYQAHHLHGHLVRVTIEQLSDEPQIETEELTMSAGPVHEAFNA